MSGAVEALRRVGYFATLDDTTLAEIAASARTETFRSGARLVTELEPGADFYVVVSGEADVSVDGAAGDRQIVGTLSAGGAFGEMSSLTGELRSATVTAKADVEVLVIADADFDRLRVRRPEIAVALVRVLAKRLGEAERSIDELLLANAASTSERVTKELHAHKGRRGSVGRAWRELVVSRGRDLGFLTLAGFVVALAVVRLAVYCSFRWDFAPKDMLRTAYMSGFFLLGGSACAALLTFRPAWRRAIAVAYGVGVAFIFNELGVTLAFDIFYKDIHTPDPNVPFDVEALYRRATPIHAIAIGLVVLFQLAYLRPFYRRAFFVVKTRLRKLVEGRGRA
jgi:CRP/FNR family cyclic AMP-dependent transcriptional regulator